jgi:hypothetical protein
VTKLTNPYFNKFNFTAFFVIYSKNGTDVTYTICEEIEGEKALNIH